MSSPPPSYRVAQAIGLTGAAWLSGNIAGASLIAGPGLLRAHREHELPSSSLVKTWKRMYDLGKSRNPPIAVITASAFFYLAWLARPNSPLFNHAAPNRASLYSAAAIMTLGFVPYTIICMAGTNNSLMAKAKLESVASAQEHAQVDSLLSTWISLNGIRSVFPLVGVLIGFFAIFD